MVRLSAISSRLSNGGGAGEFRLERANVGDGAVRAGEAALVGRRETGWDGVARGTAGQQCIVSVGPSLSFNAASSGSVLLRLPVAAKFAVPSEHRL